MKTVVFRQTVCELKNKLSSIHTRSFREHITVKYNGACTLFLFYLKILKTLK